jgi:N-acetylmuramic acid 6-phosphate etherase
MITTASMIRIGKVYSNLMVDIVPSNSKLLDRSIRLIMQATSVSRETARRYFEESDHNIKTSIVMIQAKVDRETADDALRRARGHIASALADLSAPDTP